MGCSATVACSLVAIPVMGISCDAALIGADPTQADQSALSDCEDNGSKLSQRDAIESVERGDAVAHIILISDPRATEGYGYGVAQSLAQETGGRVIQANNQRDTSEAFQQIARELRTQYLLGYTPTNNKHDGTFRKIEVKTNAGNAKVDARRGYYAPAG